MGKKNYHFFFSFLFFSAIRFCVSGNRESSHEAAATPEARNTTRGPSTKHQRGYFSKFSMSSATNSTSSYRQHKQRILLRRRSWRLVTLFCLLLRGYFGNFIWFIRDFTLFCDLFWDLFKSQWFCFWYLATLTIKCTRISRTADSLMIPASF